MHFFIKNKPAILTGVIICCFFLQSSLAANSNDPIKSKNQEVAQIETKIQSGDLPYIDINWEIETEGAPPHYKFYFNPADSQLIAVISYVGHETWSNKFSYYFDKKGQIIKYLKEIDADATMGFDPKLKRQGIVYDEAGNIIWKNVEKPYVEPKEIKLLFQKIQKISEGLSDY